MCIRDSHQTVKKVSQRPDGVNLEEGANNDKGNHQCSVNFDRFFAEQVRDVDFTEEIPADNRRKSEKQHADSDENDSSITEGASKSRLGQFGAGDAAVDIDASQNNKCCESENDKCVDKNAHHGDNALVTGILDLSSGVSVRGRTHAGFVGKEAASHAISDSLLHSNA